MDEVRGRVGYLRCMTPGENDAYRWLHCRGDDGVALSDDVSAREDSPRSGTALEFVKQADGTVVLTTFYPRGEARSRAVGTSGAEVRVVDNFDGASARWELVTASSGGMYLRPMSDGSDYDRWLEGNIETGTVRLVSTDDPEQLPAARWRFLEIVAVEAL